MKILFWLLIAADTLLLLMLFVLGLAAATSTKQSGFAVATSFPFVVPAIVLVVAILLFTRSPSTLGRSAGLLLAAAPALWLIWARGSSLLELRQNTNSNGEVAHFRAGPLREIADAIKSNDSATVARLAPTVDVNAHGFVDVTLLMLALRQLEQTPKDLAILRTLLKSGANPNLVASGELPLEVAIQKSDKAGAEPVVMLLKAGANPNTKDQFGKPVFYSGTYGSAPPEVLAALLDNGADITIKNSDGLSIAFDAALSNNWKAVLLLLQRGADYKTGRTLNGESFTQMVESHARVYGDTAGVAEVVEFLKRN
ncbi:MAG: hypothetical protein ABJB74_11145 [Gemmatimonas sp.]